MITLSLKEMEYLNLYRYQERMENEHRLQLHPNLVRWIRESNESGEWIEETDYKMAMKIEGLPVTLELFGSVNQA